MSVRYTSVMYLEYIGDNVVVGQLNPFAQARGAAVITYHQYCW